MDLDIGEAFIAYSEKHFGEVPTEFVGGLVLVAICCVCLEQIVVKVVVPAYKTSKSLLEGGRYNPFKDFNVTASILSAMVGVIFTILVYSIITYPARMELKEARAELAQNQKDMQKVYDIINNFNPPLQHPPQGP